MSASRYIGLLVLAAAALNSARAVNPPSNSDCGDSDYAEANPCDCPAGGGGPGGKGPGSGPGPANRGSGRGGPPGPGMGSNTSSSDNGGLGSRGPSTSPSTPPNFNGGTQSGQNGNINFGTHNGPRPSTGPSGSGPDCTHNFCKAQRTNSSLGVHFAFGGIPFEPDLEQGSIIIHQQAPTPTQFTPQVVRYASVLGARLVSQKTTTAEWDFDLINESGRSQTFHFPAGASVVYSSGKNYSLRLLSAARVTIPAGAGNAAPAFVRLENASGSWTEIDCTTSQPVRYKSQSGRITDLAALPAATRTQIVTQAGVLRQIKAAQGTVDFAQVETQAFEMRFYQSDQTGAYNSSSGLYPLTGAPYRTIRFSNASTSATDYGHVKITETWGTEVEESYFDYNVDLKQWTLTEGDATLKRIESKDIIPGPGTNETTVRHFLKDEAGRSVSTTHEVKRRFPWGEQTVTYIKEPGTLNLASSYTYHEAAGQSGYQKMKSQQEPDGSWAAYTYDANGRLLETTRPWKDSVLQFPLVGARQITSRSYTSLEAGDFVGSYDPKPRTVTTSVVLDLGATPIVTGRTWHVYKTDAQGVYTEIEERAATAGAVFGAGANLRTTRIFYTTLPTQSGYDATSAGYLRYEDRPDGLRVSYSYTRDTASSEAYFTTSESWGTPAQPEGVDGLSTRTDYIHNVKGYLVKIESYLRAGGAWQLYATEARTFNGQGFHILTTFNGRQTYAASYRQSESPPSAETGLLFSETDESGTTTTYGYDALGKIETRIVKGMPASGTYAAQSDVATTYLRELGGLDCGCDGEVTTLTSAGAFSLETRTKKDAVGRLTYERDSAGLETNYNYYNAGRQFERTNPDGGTEAWTRFADGSLAIHAGSGTTARYYDYGVNADGSRWTKTSHVTSAGPRSSKTTSDVLGRITTVEKSAFDTGLIRTTYTYDSKGNLVRIRKRHMIGPGVNELVESTVVADSLAEYDVFGNIVRHGLDVNANGVLDLASTDRITDLEFGFVSQDSTWWVAQTTKVYPVESSSAAVQVSSLRQRYSGLTGTLAAELVELDLDGHTTRNRLEVLPQAVVTETITYPDSVFPALQITRNRRLVSESAPNGSIPTLYGYDALGRVSSIQRPRQTQATTVAYASATGRLIGVTDAAGNPTSYAYYENGQVGAGRIKLITDTLGHTSRFAYNLKGRLVYQWGTATYPQAYTYTDNGELATLTTWRDTGTADLNAATWPALTGGDVTTWIYQGFSGLLTRKQYADGKGTDYTYDKLNRLATRTWARTAALPALGSPLVTTYGYVPTTGQLATVNYSDATPDVTTTFDRLGRRASVTDVTGQRTFTYDGTKLRLQSENLPAYFDARVLTRDYQVPGAGQVSGRYAGYQLGSVSDPDQDFAVSYGYDTAGRLNGVSSPAGSYAYGYTPNSDLLASVTSPVHVAATVFEPQRDVIDYVENKVGTSTISKYDYTVNAVGQRTSRAQSGIAFQPSYGNNPVDNFAYNPKGEVISSNRPVFPVFDQTYIYDQIGNLRYHGRTSSGENYTANSVNQYTQIWVPYEINPTFDADGNQLTTALGQAYVWDAENRLTSVEPVVATAGSQKITYVYDAFSRRVRRTAFTFTSGAWVQSSDVKYIYEGWNLVGVLGWNTATGTFILQKTYTWGLDLSGSLQGAGGVGGLLGVSEITSGQVSASYHYTYDANGNVGQLVNASGAVVAHYEYDAFGNSIQASGMYAGQNEYRFSTKPFDGASGMYYYGFRYYNPTAGRWPSRDPIEENGGLNLYGMVGNDSINWVDLWGLDSYVYDGKKICKKSDSGECLKCWAADSGKPTGVDKDGNPTFDYSPDRQKSKNDGPIPEGDYWLPSNQTTDPSKSGNWNTDDWNNYESSDGDGWKPGKTNVDPRSTGSWGDRFGRLDPDPSTATHGRSLFNVHGGSTRGSAGCIDMGACDVDFYDDVRRTGGGNKMKVKVDYSGSSTSGCPDPDPCKK